MNTSRIFISVAVSLAFSGAALAQSAPVKKADGVLVTGEGMTVYTFDKDTAEGKSVCYGGCAAAWPPVPAGDAKLTSPYSSITRDDGVKQVAYKGKPLYTFVQDKKAGDRTGDNVKDVWHVVKD